MIQVKTDYNFMKGSETMKKLLAIILTTLIVMVLAVGCSKNDPEGIHTYSWEEASDHIEEAATVTGPVISAGNLLHAGLPYYFTLVLGVNDNGGVFVQMLGDLAESLPEDQYVGHTIAVTGRIIELVWQGEHTGTKIWVDDLSKIEIIE